MPSLADIVDTKSRVNYQGLIAYISSCQLDEFTAQARHPFLVGQKLYEGELRSNVNTEEGGSTHTMKFSVALFREKMKMMGGANLQAKQEDANSEKGGMLSHAIYMLRKNPYGTEANRNVITIGRKTGSDIVVADYVVSKNHAQIIIFGNRYFIADLNSTNGTFVNDKPLAPGVKMQLQLNYTITFGRICFVFISPIELYRILRRESVGL